MTFGPMTIIVTVFLAVCLLLGISILVGSYAAASAGPSCTRCRHVNRREAKFCAHCGTPLGR